MSDNADFLPDEIVTQILLRLPIKSIIISICVCKTWKSIIQNPTFISTHLHRSINNNNNHHHLLFRLREDDADIEQIYALHNDDDNDFTEHTRFDFPFQGPDFNAMYNHVDTINGLLCLSDDLDSPTNLHQFLLWNPCVRKFLKLPSPNVTYETHGEFNESIGFGFDTKNNDFKVVKLVTTRENFNLRKDRPLVELYSLSTGEWRMITASLPPICGLAHRERHVFVNGALHWLALRMTDYLKIYCFILVFDLGDEVFREILLPEDPDYFGASLSVYGNSIAFFQEWASCNGGHFNIWVMKEYGVASSWTKVLTVANQGREGEDISRPIGFRRNGEVMLKMDDGQLVSQDLETQERKDLRINSYNYTFVDYYVESLVLLDKAANDVVTY
jgi:F-box interacting protein